MIATPLLLISLFAIALVLSACGGVNIVDSDFDSSTITIPVGTTVAWTHKGQFPHTVTADDESFDSDNLGNGDTFPYTFNQAETYPYYCAYLGGPSGHGMSGVVMVTNE